jgi:hypothetical protein
MPDAILENIQGGLEMTIREVFERGTEAFNAHDIDRLQG